MTAIPATLTLTSEEFAVQCQQWAAQTLAADERELIWVWRVGADPDAGGYLSKLVPVRLRAPLDEDARSDDEPLPVMAGISQIDDVAELAPTTRRALDWHEYHYHIVYSSSYRVPVFYFTAYDATGMLLSLTEVLADLQAVATSEWPKISQEEHPVLGVPYFFYHPCRTAQLLAELASRAAVARATAVLAIWYAVYAPLVGIPRESLAHYRARVTPEDNWLKEEESPEKGEQEGE
jgi:ubiquitin-like-conjugating enzyme ATG10